MAAVVAGFVWFQYLPLKKARKVLGQRRVTQTLAIARSMKESKQVPILEEQLRKLRRTVGDYEVNIPAERALGVFLHRVANLMSEYHLTEQVVQPGKEIEMDELTCIPLDMQCKGKLKQIFEFFRHMRRLDRLVRIMHVKLTNDRDFSGQVTMQTKAMLYYKMESPH